MLQLANMVLPPARKKTWLLALHRTSHRKSALDLKFTELHLTLEGINNCIEVNTKHITEAQSSISDVEDYVTSLSNKTSALEKEVKTLS